MKYLTIIPDYTASCLRDDFEGPIEVEELELPQDFIRELSSWHDSYRKIIPLGDEERAMRIEEIEQLDSKGLELAKKLKDLVPGGAKVKYYSEGKFKFLHVD